MFPERIASPSKVIAEGPIGAKRPLEDPERRKHAYRKRKVFRRLPSSPSLESKQDGTNRNAQEARPSDAPAPRSQEERANREQT